jgi:hypothetical protein
MYLSRTALLLYKIERKIEKSPISQLCFLFITYLSLQLFVCSVYLTTTDPRRVRSYNLTAHSLLRQSDIPTGHAVR